MRAYDQRAPAGWRASQPAGSSSIIELLEKAMLHDDGSTILTGRSLTPVEIYAEMARRLKQGGRAAMATIIRTKGSTPQQLGAKLVVFDDGSFLGTVGGGCVEADIWAECREVMRTGRAGIFHFNLGGDYEDADAMVCGGQMDVLIEPWYSSDESAETLD